jgi:predicted dehydrogenase
LIGAGRFATATLVPGLISQGFRPAAVASAGGLSAEGARRQFGFEEVLSGGEALFDRDDIDLVAIATRHDSHAALAAAALRAGHAVYVEKPLALDEESLLDVHEAQLASGAPLIVGFNRRHAPLARELAKIGGPRLMHYRVNAGRLSADHWTNDLELGGGRLVGEGCHFIDFLCAQAGSDPLTVTARGFRSADDLPLRATDNFSLQIAFADGSVGTINYAADAPTGPGKERFESTSPEGYAVLDDFRRAVIWSQGRRRRYGGRRQDKGFSDQYRLLADVVAGRRDAPSADQYLLSSLLTLVAARALESGQVEPVTEGQVGNVLGRE